MKALIPNKTLLYTALLIIVLTSTSAIIIPFPASAASKKKNVDDQGRPWFEVEIIILANKQKKGLESETWPDNPEYLSHREIIQLVFPGREGEFQYEPTDMLTALPVETAIDPNHIPTPEAAETKAADPVIINLEHYQEGAYTFLPPDKLNMNDIVQKLSSNNDYDVLLHFGWRQPTYSQKESIPIHIFDKMDKPNAPFMEQPAAPIENEQAMAGSLEMSGFVPAMAEGPNYSQLSGTIKLSVSRYLHLATDLHFRSPIIQQEAMYPESSVETSFSSFFGGGGNTQPVYIDKKVVLDFNLRETRRMRSKEYHFFDHPMVSMIARVIPYEIPIPEVEEIPSVEIEVEPPNPVAQ